MQLKSKNKRIVLMYVGYYWCMPYTDECLDLLLKHQPQLKDKKTIANIIKHLVEEDLISRENVFSDKKNNSKDALIITSKGIECLIENKLLLSPRNSCVYQRKYTYANKKNKYVCSESELFFTTGTKNNINPNFIYYSRDTITDISRKKGLWELLKEISNTRISGFLIVQGAMIPVLNVKDRNIMVFRNSENTYAKRVGDIFNKDVLYPKQKIILTNTVEFFDKTFYQERDAGLIEPIEISNKKAELIFPKVEYRSKIKSHLLLCNVEQTEIIELFQYENIDKKIRTHILNINDEKIKNDLHLREKDKSIGEGYYSLSIYETDKEVGFEIVMQELHRIYRIVQLVQERQQKKRESRKIVIYGLGTNLDIFKKVFIGDINNLKFVEIQKNDILNS